MGFKPSLRPVCPVVPSSTKLPFPFFFWPYFRKKFKLGAGWEPNARTKVTLHLFPLSEPHPEEMKLPGLTFPTTLRSCAANKRAGMSTETQRLLFPPPWDHSAWSRGAGRYPGGKVLSSPHHSLLPKKSVFQNCVCVCADWRDHFYSAES